MTDRHDSVWAPHIEELIARGYVYEQDTVADDDGNSRTVIRLTHAEDGFRVTLPDLDFGGGVFRVALPIFEAINPETGQWEEYEADDEEPGHDMSRSGTWDVPPFNKRF